MKNLKSLLLFAAISLPFSQGVLASGEDASVTVTSLPASASLSTTNQSSSVAYRIDVRNISTDDTLKVLTLRASTKVTTLGVPVVGTTANYVGGPAFCATPVLTDPTVIECTLNQVLTPADPLLSFVVVFSTPTAGDTIKLSTRTKYAEYESGEYYIEPDDIESISKSATTALTVRDGTNVSTYLGNGGIVRTSLGTTSGATAPDSQTTLLNVPAAQGATPVTIKESVTPVDPAVTCASALFLANKCFVIRTTLAENIQFAAPFLSVALEIFKGELAGSSSTYSSSYYYKPKPPSISLAVIEYQHVESPPSGVITLQNCSKDKYGNLRVGPGYIYPQPGVPCIFSRTVLSNGNWLFKVLQADNGRLVIR
ncbi:MAG: hypothetical protein ABL900_08075 [Burkholderiaceae bacterium]